jgi:hypothetical protein
MMTGSTVLSAIAIYCESESTYYISMYSIAVNIRFLLTISKEDAENIFFQFTSMAHLTNMFCMAF